MFIKRAGALEEQMELMISVVLLLGAAVLGAWRLETDFDRETHPQPIKESDYRAGKFD